MHLCEWVSVGVGHLLHGHNGIVRRAYIVEDSSELYSAKRRRNRGDASQVLDAELLSECAAKVWEGGGGWFSGVGREDERRAIAGSARAQRVRKGRDARDKLRDLKQPRTARYSLM